MKKLLFPVLFGLATTASAQPGSTGPGVDPQSPTAVPLDGGASLLLASGAAYAWRRLRKSR